MEYIVSFLFVLVLESQHLFLFKILKSRPQPPPENHMFVAEP